MSKLKGNVAVVTGSSKGIGEGGKRMAAENSLIDSAPRGCKKMWTGRTSCSARCPRSSF